MQTSDLRYPTEVVQECDQSVTVRALSHREFFEFTLQLVPHINKFSDATSLADLLKSLQTIILITDELSTKLIATATGKTVEEVQAFPAPLSLACAAAAMDLTLTENVVKNVARLQASVRRLIPTAKPGAKPTTSLSPKAGMPPISTVSPSVK